MPAPARRKSLAWVGNAQLRGVGQWLFSQGTAKRCWPSSTRSSVCDKSTGRACACVLAGIGLGIFPDYSVADDIARGRLVRVFADWTLPSGGIHAVFPPARFRPAKVRAFVDLLVAAERRRARSAVAG